MEKSELGAFLERIKGFYPSFKIEALTPESWFSIFDETPNALMIQALEAYTKENKFAPTVAGIIEFLPKTKKAQPIAASFPLKNSSGNPDIVKVYRSDSEGRRVYSLENKYGTFRRSQVAKQQLIETEKGALDSIVNKCLSKIETRL